MKKDNFKFNLGDRVFYLGHTGACRVSGRGTMEYLSGGKINMYQIGGAHNIAVIPEYLLLTLHELKQMLQEEMP